MKKKVVSAAVSVAVLSSSFVGAASASTYAVQKGDTLGKIAKNNHMSVQDLRKLNNLKSDLIRVNQVLKLDSKLQAAAKVPALKVTSAPTSSSIASVYTVASGDTLSGIAYRFKVKLSDLMEWNNLKSTLIFPGKQLKVSQTGTVQVTAPTNTSITHTSNSSYTIKSGDTLGALAKEFGSTVADLKKLNKLTSDRIYVGEKLKISITSSSPVKVTPAPVASTPTKTVAPAAPITSTPSKAAAPVAPVTKTTTPAAPASTAPTAAAAQKDYVVTNGDTLGTIAAQFNTTISAIKKLNNLSSDLIYVGQQLSIDSQSVTTSAPSVSDLAASVIQEAKAVMGVPYVWGGTTLKGFDCSGFIYYVFNKAGYSIGRTTAAGLYSRAYYVDQPEPGDLVFFDNTYKQGVSHVGIYLGNNQFIHADENQGVAITSLSVPYFQQHFDGFKRLY